MGFLPDAIHLKEVAHGDAGSGTHPVIAESDVVDFHGGILLLRPQPFHIRLVHVAGSIAQPGFRTAGAILQGFREMPVEVVGGKRVNICLQLIVVAFVTLAARKPVKTCC